MTSAAAIDGVRGADETLARQPLWDYVRASGLRTLVVCTSKNPNAKIVVLLVTPTTGRPIAAVKYPTTDAAARAVEAEARALVELDALGVSVGGTIPRVLEEVDVDGRRGVVMTAAEGLPMKTAFLRWRHTATRARVQRDFAAIDAWVTEFQRVTTGQPAPMDIGAHVASRLRRRFADVQGLEDDIATLDEIRTRLRQDTTPRTAVQGDLWLGNVLLDGERVSGVVDWEAAASVGEPVRDVVRFALMYALFLDRRTRVGRRVAGHRAITSGDWGAGVAYGLDGSGWFPELVRGFIRNALARLGASPSVWRDAALAGVAEIAADADDDEFARRHLELFRRLASEQPQGGHSAS
jgi:aminoglycoside phosphotransferase